MERRLAAYKEHDDHRVSTGMADTEMGSTAAGRALPPQRARTAAGREGTTQAIETQYPGLPPIKYIQRSTWIWPPSLRVGGPGLGARTSAPPSSCLSRLPWEVASESQILGFTVISLKNKNENIRFFF